ncbi:hypothetical protein BSZ35_05970 [Salinibacter sp. 10B]|uniref:hypothetical protein n=1 Tax=Salinibacter sp. 10B TaxID=1923971 RepID=UPI000CF53577|nr:hypothetical protein [Salinibacter sp. 10B]PQJ34208.1 hypothetical protein BSZ35_05970 [Salinibacter sp. 10B]
MTEAFTGAPRSFDDGPTPSDLSDDAPLPVDVASLDAPREDDDIVVTWRTASETNNAGFRLECKTKTEDRWTQVETLIDGSAPLCAAALPAPGRDLSPNTYPFRLTSVSTNGSEAVGPNTTVEVRMESAYAVSSVHPNPVAARDEVQVRDKQTVRVVLSNVLGQTVRPLHDRDSGQNTPQTVDVNGSLLPACTGRPLPALPENDDCTVGETALM